jgi:hypothetical protein
MMAKRFRPVVETWGTNSDCFLSSEELESVLIDLATFADEEGGTVTSDYDENRVLWIQNGAAFLNLIDGNSVEELCAMNSDWQSFDGDPEDPATQRAENVKTVLGNMKSLCSEWRASLDPGDGGLTFYIDQY